MTAQDGRGGYRQPSQPAAVSNPGSGRRTDGGAGSTKQPLRVPTGGRYGEAKALTGQQQAAPMAAGGGAPPPGGMAPGGPRGGGLPPDMGGGVFGPSQVSGAPPGILTDPTQMMAQDPQMFLRVLASKFPHPAIRRLVDWSAARATPPRATGPPPAQGPPTTMSQRAAVPPPREQEGVPPSPTAPGVATAENFPTPQEAIEQGP